MQSNYHYSFALSHRPALGTVQCDFFRQFNVKRRKTGRKILPLRLMELRHGKVHTYPVVAGRVTDTVVNH